MKKYRNNSKKLEIKKMINKQFQYKTLPFKEEKSELESEKNNKYFSEKQRIESIPLEELTFRDLYQFPFKKAKYDSWVYDSNHNFIFQFQINNEIAQYKIIKILNGDDLPTKQNNINNINGIIFVNNIELIMIRGWGNLTGTGSYNLDGKYASKIQDSLEQYIVEKLTFKNNE